MSQTKQYSGVHKLTLRNKSPEDANSKVSSGGNSEVFIDDKKIRGIKFLKIEVKAGTTAKVQMELIADLQIEGQYELGSYFPTHYEREEPTDKSEEIYLALKKGGLVYADRGTGKTKALTRILRDDPKAVVIVGQMVQKQQLLKYFPEGKDRILTNPTPTVLLLKSPSHDSKIYVDEYDLNFSTSYNFFAAVTSKVNVIK